MKRTERIGAMVKILTDTPLKPYSLQYFCDLFGAAKSSISEDIQAASAAISLTGDGYLETISGAKGGVRYIPDISQEHIEEILNDFCRKLEDPSRLVGGNFLYTSDIFYNAAVVKGLAYIFAKKFMNLGANYVATLETKGIPIAYDVAHLLNLPLVVVRREPRFSEGSTVSINYFSGSEDRIQKMSMSKRAIAPNSKALIIDDFMRGGGSLAGIQEILSEFSCEAVGVGVAIVADKDEKKKISKYTPLVYLEKIDESEKIITAKPNTSIF